MKKSRNQARGKITVWYHRRYTALTEEATRNQSFRQWRRRKIDSPSKRGNCSNPDKSDIRICAHIVCFGVFILGQTLVVYHEGSETEMVWACEEEVHKRPGEEVREARCWGYVEV
ncbi:hypothetical protein H5410_009410 [Solanum commersonii]|uniref:Uncharacterized protein n=1 Tax=Solanum commersonii TaxID=4109 RepID=A0A9J6AHY2_SOLCO|nr:hypothetical protein H5410_009410 [Solanum commersonii]